MELSPLTITLLDKVASDNGFDLGPIGEGDWRAYASTQVSVRIWLTAVDDGYLLALSDRAVAAELGDSETPGSTSVPTGTVAVRRTSAIPELHAVVRRAFELSRSLPDALLRRFERETVALPRATEAERLVVQRVGQDLFRAGLLDYWQRRCAITGLAVEELLRASHIKPWAACESDAERLDVFNGLLLAPHLDAAFDAGFITIADDGQVVVTGALDATARRQLGLDEPLRVTSLTDAHRHYLQYHRASVFKATGGVQESTSPEVRRPTQFQRYVGIDYSGADTADARLDGIRVYVASGEEGPRAEPQSNRRWSRRAVAEWLVRLLGDGIPTIVGIDHGFSFPLAYFERHGLRRSWDEFLVDFRRHWPTDGDNVRVRDLLDDPDSLASDRRGERDWKRLTEKRAGATKGVFFFGVHGEVATSTHAGLPWLLSLRRALASRVHFWPFDGWKVPADRSAVVEVYPALWKGQLPLSRVEEGPAQLTPHHRDAYTVAAWLQQADRDGSLTDFLEPVLTETERSVAEIEGWILGVE
ncbi:MAG TPA: HNH endonuclease [Trueperaceae bacterium]